MRRLLASVEDERDAEDADDSLPVRRYPPEEQVRDDLRELLTDVSDHFGALDQAIEDAGSFRTFFLALGFLRDSTMDGYTFVMEWDKRAGLWSVGYRRENRRARNLKDLIVRRPKIDEAVAALFDVWKGAVEGWREDGEVDV